MIKLYNIDDLLNINFKGYARVMSYLRKNVGDSSDDGLIRYAKQAGYKASSDGTLYKEVY